MRTQLENWLNIYLPRSIHLHHIDCNRKNNSLENLILVRAIIHRKIHKAIRKGCFLKTRKDLHAYLRELEEPRKLWLIFDKRCRGGE